MNNVTGRMSLFVITNDHVKLSLHDTMSCHRHPVNNQF